MTVLGIYSRYSSISIKYLSTMFIIVLSISSIITVSAKHVNISQHSVERAIDSFADNFAEDPFVNVVDIDRVDGEILRVLGL